MKMSFEELNAALDACIEAGEIYNVDFGDFKYAAERLLGADYTVATDVYLTIPRDDRDESDIELYWGGGNGPIVQFPSKRFLKILDATNTAYGDDVRIVVATWTPVAEKFRTLKPMIIKGRKPSTTPRVTPERTLENTGTCAVCGQNVKMNGGKIVSHGYTIRSGYQEGSCLGVGYDPIEISDEGLRAYRATIEVHLSDVNDTLARFANPEFNPPLVKPNSFYRTMDDKLTVGDPDYDTARAGVVYGLEADKRFFVKSLASINKALETWTPGTLPG